MKVLTLTGLTELIAKIKNQFIDKNDTITATLVGVDSVPTTSSSNLITSGGVKSALDDKVSVSVQSLTDNQKLQARSNIGASKDLGDYELIKEIELTEDVNSIIINVDDNNSSFDLKEAYVSIFQNTPTTANYGQVSISYQYKYNSSYQNVFMILTNSISMSSNIYTYDSLLSINGGVWELKQSVVNNSLITSIYKYKASGYYNTLPYYYLPNKYLNQIKINATGILPTGTKIKLYGIRV